MKAVILNSGLGKRMGALTENKHKSMVSLSSGETVFGRQLRLLYACGIRDLLITTGPYEASLRAQVAQALPADCRVEYVRNPEYESTNYIYSLYLARHALQGELLLLHGDLVFDRDFVMQLLAAPEGNLAAVNTHLPVPEKDFKARVQEGRIREISVNILGPDCFAMQPFYKLDKGFVRQWVERITLFVEQGQRGCYAENALNELLEGLRLKPFSYEQHYVEEIDTPEDHHRVSRDIRTFDFAHQQVLSAPRATQHLPSLLHAWGIQRPFLVCDAAYPHLPVQAALDKAGISPVAFSAFTPNPVYEDVAAGVRAYQKSGCDGILSVGGGSAMDVAKCIKLFSRMDANAHYLDQPFEFSPVPHIAVPTTAGTGSECTRFAVIYRDGVKQSVTHDCLFPDAAVLDAQLLATLPDHQRKAGFLDALCHSVESMWSLNATPGSQALSAQALKALLDNAHAYFQKPAPADSAAPAVMPAAEEAMLAANEAMPAAPAGMPAADEAMPAAHEVMLAAHDAGLAINLTQTTAAHAMSYKLTSLYGIAHGHAAALCLLAVWEAMITRQEIGQLAPGRQEVGQLAPGRQEAGQLESGQLEPGPDSPETQLLTSAFASIAEAAGLPTIRQAYDRVAGLVAQLALPPLPALTPEDLRLLTASVDQQRLANNPVAFTPDEIQGLYLRLWRD